ncbi:MAG: hypothetical protein QM539_00290 [Alphaproteobacteria bacterium]|nr:hypothetical protein [Alphaproteobacteria bacterium]
MNKKKVSPKKEPKEELKYPLKQETISLILYGLFLHQLYQKNKHTIEESPKTPTEEQ